MAVHADLWRAIHEKAKDIGYEHNHVHNIKAHLSEDAEQQPVWCTRANAVADMYAKRGAALHIVDEGALTRIKRSTITVTVLAKFIAYVVSNALKLFEQCPNPTPSPLGPPAPGLVVGAPPVGIGH